jgi:hypothetical protein
VSCGARLSVCAVCRRLLSRERTDLGGPRSETRAWGLKSARRISDLLTRAAYLHRNPRHDPPFSGHSTSLTFSPERRTDDGTRPLPVPHTMSARRRTVRRDGTGTARRMAIRWHAISWKRRASRHRIVRTRIRDRAFRCWTRPADRSSPDLAGAATRRADRRHRRHIG